MVLGEISKQGIVDSKGPFSSQGLQVPGMPSLGVGSRGMKRLKKQHIHPNPGSTQPGLLWLPALDSDCDRLPGARAWN